MTAAGLLGSDAPRPRAVRAAALALAGLLALAALYRPASEYDFCTYYSAGLAVRAGAPEEAFDQEALNRRHAALHGSERRKGPFLYSPLWLLPAALLAGQPFPRAERLNQLAALLCLAAALGVLLRRVPGAVSQAAFAAAFVLAHPVGVQFVYLNWSFLLLLLVAFAWQATSAGREVPAALAWALAIHLKPFVALALVALWLSGRRRLALGAAGATAAFALATLPWLGWGSWSAFAGKALAGTASGILPFYNNVSLPGALARLVTEPRSWVAPRAAVVGGWVAAVALAGVALLAWGLRRTRGDGERALAVSFVWLLLFFPLVWDHTAVLLLAALPALGRREQALFAAALAGTYFYGPLVQRGLLAALAGGPTLLLLALLALPALLHLAALAALLARRGSALAVAGS